MRVYLFAQMLKCLFSFFSLCTNPTCVILFKTDLGLLFKKRHLFGYASGSHRSDFFSPGDIWQCLLAFLVVTAWGWERKWLASSRQRTRMVLSVLQCTGEPQHQRIILPKMSIVLQLRNPTQTQGPIKIKTERARWLRVFVEPCFILRLLMYLSFICFGISCQCLWIHVLCPNIINVFLWV